MVHAETVRFNIYKGNEQIGNIKADKENTSTTTTYTVISTASFELILNYVRETFMKVIYKNEELLSSDSQLKINHHLKEHRTTNYINNLYVCKNNTEKEEFKIEKKIRFSASMLYFEEPIGQSLIFAESYQQMCPLKLIQTGIYKLELPEGKINHYVYKNGILQEIRVFRSMVDLIFKKAD